MTFQPVLPDVEDVLIAYLAPLFDQARFVTALPDKLGQQLPVVQVVRATGAVVVRRHDRAFVDVNVIDTDDVAASALARQIEPKLIVPINATFPDLGAVLKSGESLIRPRHLPYPNPDVRFWGATYSIWLRSA